MFSSKTGRNQPSNSKFVFGLSAWLRGLIKPSPGYGLAYIDWSQQEFGIAAALSGDHRMQEAYLSGDPYLTFAKQAGAAQADATKAALSLTPTLTLPDGSAFADIKKAIQARDALIRKDLIEFVGGQKHRVD